ncbi:hypothetical protein [Olsenella profusa]|nr:hypothetical protein [Olsenella profusa]
MATATMRSTTVRFCERLRAGLIEDNDLRFDSAEGFIAWLEAE